MDTKIIKRKSVRVRTAAEMLDVCPKTIKNWIKRGKLSSTLVCGLQMVHYDSIEKLFGQKEAA